MCNFMATHETYVYVPFLDRSKEAGISSFLPEAEAAKARKMAERKVFIVLEGWLEDWVRVEILLVGR